MAIFEICFYALNEAIFSRMAVTDVGGAVTIHTFGAFFGLACSRVMINQNAIKDNAENSAVYHSDMFAMVRFSS
jgi:ammonium transporter Rh